MAVDPIRELVIFAQRDLDIIPRSPRCPKVSHHTWVTHDSTIYRQMNGIILERTNNDLPAQKRLRDGLVGSLRIKAMPWSTTIHVEQNCKEHGEYRNADQIQRTATGLMGLFFAWRGEALAA